jgi:glycosyltransferase involved in cell wall biosynthesis
MNGIESSKALSGVRASCVDVEPAIGRRPLVSVIIPAFNAEATISATLASVLKQTWTSFEVIVVDDGSTDRTAEIVEDIARTDIRIRIYRQKNLGAAEARNAGVRESAGEWIAPLDADDLWNPDTLERELRQAQSAGNKVAVIYSWSTTIGVDDLPLGGVSMASLHGRVFSTLLCHNFLGNGSCTLVRRSALESVGGYRQRYSPMEDWDLYLRLAEQYEFVPVKRFLIRYRHSVLSASSNCELMAEAQVRMLADIQRRNPDVPSWLCRFSQSNLYVYFARRNRQRADAAATRRWLWRATGAHWIAAARLDWWWLLACGGWKTGVMPPADSPAPSLLARTSQLVSSALLHKSLGLLARFNLLRTDAVPSKLR